MQQITIKLGERHYRMLQELKRDHETTGSEIVRRAVTLFDIAIKYRDEGYRLATLDSGGKVRTILVL